MGILQAHTGGCIGLASSLEPQCIAFVCVNRQKMHMIACNCLCHNYSIVFCMI